jgi:hypothetical protein
VGPFVCLLALDDGGVCEERGESAICWKSHRLFDEMAEECWGFELLNVLVVARALGDRGLQLRGRA